MKSKKKKAGRHQNLETMNLLTAVDQAYLQPLSVMLYSFAVHHSGQIRLFILYCSISEQQKNCFCEKVAKWNRAIDICFLKVDVEELADVKFHGRFRYETNLRLLLLAKVPREIDRILWLDTDIIVRGNIYNFYTYPDHSQCALVCEDMFPRWEKFYFLSQIGMKMTDRYFNAGVILFYMKNMRMNFRNTSFLQWMSANPDKLKFPDQNTLNVCLKGKLSWAKPEIYNLQLLRVNREMRKSGKIKKSKIIHYNTKEKPWEDDYYGEGEMEFWRYGIYVLGVRKFLIHYIKKYKRIMAEYKSKICYLKQ